MYIKKLSDKHVHWSYIPRVCNQKSVEVLEFLPFYIFLPTTVNFEDSLTQFNIYHHNTRFK